MKKCEVIADRVALTVAKGGIVYVEDKQFEVAKKFIKPIEETEKKTKKKATKEK